ncbi:hypothetical protein GCM10007036_00470 [Alsobacter metallidurans]|uniref:YEATS-Like-Associating Three TM domain-containing protein n=1 Tax=Alsobacter metallidurans TaxID=340221 RepID=A0A917I3H4_9HYPH|nr:YEATS-associated helix-containing protein [Alsobacter metallidurans]GGH06201.1 hypothetical protein GCM10007036_00470 [Alsobacter metallidurans]
MFLTSLGDAFASATAADAGGEASRFAPLGVAVMVMFIAGGMGSVCRNVLEPSYSAGTVASVVLPGLVAASFVPLLLSIGKSTVLSAVLAQGEGWMESAFLLFAFCLVAGMSARSFIEEMRDQSPIAGLELEGIAELLFKGARDGWRSMVKRRHEAGATAIPKPAIQPARACPAKTPIATKPGGEMAASSHSLDDPTLRSLLERLSAQLVEPAPAAGQGLLQS